MHHGYSFIDYQSRVCCRAPSHSSAAGNRCVALLRMCPHLLLLMKSWPHVVSPLQSFLSPPFVLRQKCEVNAKSSGEET